MGTSNLALKDCATVGPINFKIDHKGEYRMNRNQSKFHLNVLAAILIVVMLFGIAATQIAQAAELLERHIALPATFASSPAGGAMTATSSDHNTGTGAWRSANNLIEYYIDPTLPPYSFGTIKVSDIAGVSYLTKNGDAAAVNFGFYIYTVGTKYGWYQERLIAEPMYSINYSDAPDTWNTWNTAVGPNQLAFYDSHYSAMGFYYGPTLADIQAAPITWSAWDTITGSPTPIDYRDQTVKFFKFGTGSAWSSSFDGLIDTIVISLKNGDSLNIDLEETVPTVYVDDDWNRFNIGQDPDGDAGPIQGIGLDAASSIQQGIDMVSPGGTVNVFPGTYSETAANRTVLNLGGVYQFGLFVSSEKSGITVQGVDAAGAAITGYANVVADVVTNATNNFGPSGVFIEGDDVTLSGLRILPNTSGDNKTVEVIGNNFSLKASVIDVAGGGSVYLNDWRFDKTGQVSYLQSYTILNNRFAQSASLDIASGAGFTGPVAGRVIQGNRFEYTPDAYWPAISFSGNSVVPWFTDPINGATITGNTFVGTTQHIRARGGYDNATFDWVGYRANNTFDKTVMTFVGDTAEVRSYEYATSYGNMVNVRRIGSVIQSDVDEIAQAGDTVDASAGVFEEQVTIEALNGLTLQGAGATLTTIKSPVTLTSLWGDRKAVVGIQASNDVTVQDLTVDGAGRNNGNYRMFGILFHNASGLIDQLAVKDIRYTPLDGMQSGVAIYAYNEDNTPRAITVSNNTVTGYQKGGIVMNGVGLTAHVVDNTVTGIGPTPLIAMNGIQFAYGSTGTITGNDISGHAYTGADYSAAGILIYGASGIEISQNLIHDNQVGISISDDAFLGNGGSDNLVIESNDITHNAWGITSSHELEANSNLAISFNRIVGNTTAGIDNSSAVANAENNWWGCNAGPNQTGCDTFTGAVDAVDADPWLTLTFTADQTQLTAGGDINLTTRLTRNSAGTDTSLLGMVMDGIPAAFEASYGTLNPTSGNLVNATAATVLSVPDPVTVTSATASVTVDNQTVTVIFGGLKYIFLPVISN